MLSAPFVLPSCPHCSERLWFPTRQTQHCICVYVYTRLKQKVFLKLQSCHHKYLIIWQVFTLWIQNRKSCSSFMCLSQFDKSFSSSSFVCFLFLFYRMFLRKNGNKSNLTVEEKLLLEILGTNCICHYKI